jgi:hypothetical protein
LTRIVVCFLRASFCRRHLDQVHVLRLREIERRLDGQDPQLLAGVAHHADFADANTLVDPDVF